MKVTRNMKDVVEGSTGTGSSKYLISEGEHTFIVTEVTDKTTKNGDPMAVIKLECALGDVDAGKWCFDNIVIPEPTSPSIAILGRSKHFLHCIGEPYETDNLEIDTDNWINKIVMAEVFTEAPNNFHPKFPMSKISKYILSEGDSQPNEVTLPGEEMFNG